MEPDVGKRRKAREIVLQALYEAEFSDRTREEIIKSQADERASSEDTVEYATTLFASVLDHVDRLDDEIRNAVEHWDFGRISLVDKSILRFAMAEILYFHEIPTKVIINEAIDIAHKYSSSDAGKFVNGVLDKFASEHRRND